MADTVTSTTTDATSATSPITVGGEDHVDHLADRWLRILASPIRVFATMILVFSVVGGTLQELTRRGSSADAILAVAGRVSGNLIVSTVAIIVIVWWLRHRNISRISYRLGFTAGILGGLGRVPFEVFVWDERQPATLAISVLTEGLWLLMAAVVTRLISGFAARLLAEGQRLTSALESERETRALMLQADRRLRQEVAEWLHGRLQSELIVAATEVRRLGGDGVVVADRLDAIRTNDVRGLAHSLHPALITIDLEAALSELATMADTAGIVTLDYRDETIHEMLAPTVSPDVAIAIQRIVEEGLNNALRHGEAEPVTIVVRILPRRVGIDITNAIQTRDRAITPGLGLRIIDSWVRSLDGDWRLSAKDGQMVLTVQLARVRPPMLTDGTAAAPHSTTADALTPDSAPFGASAAASNDPAGRC